MARSLVDDRLVPRLASRGFYPDRATIELNTPTRTGSGAETPGWAGVPGLVNIPAAVSPMIFTRAGEQRSGDRTVSETTHRIGLAGSFPGINSRHRIVVTGAHAGIYDVIRQDLDSQAAMTVLEARIVSPVAAAGI